MGLMFAAHGYPLVMGGAQAWNHLGAALPIAGPPSIHTFFGFLAAMSEFGGGLLLALGLLTRLAAFFLFFTMAVAFSFHLRHGDNFNTYSHAVEAGIVFFSLIFIGPGKYSLDAKLDKFNPLLRR
jgi:putative oxidoreductase